MINSSTDIIIIGAGIAGLAAGCYAQMNGYRTRIFELHNQPGGLCTAGERKGYIFDGCIHYLFGSGKGQPFYRLWEELGAVQGRHFVHHDELMRIIGLDGKTLIVYCNPDKLEQHLKELSPADSGKIEEFCAGIRAFADFDMTLLRQKPKALMSFSDWGEYKDVAFCWPASKVGKYFRSGIWQYLQRPLSASCYPANFCLDKHTNDGWYVIASLHAQR
jgi:phytoene dehydrogenase-like protein